MKALRVMLPFAETVVPLILMYETEGLAAAYAAGWDSTNRETPTTEAASLLNLRPLIILPPSLC